MNVVAEMTIDIDDRRKIWVTMNAEDLDPNDLPKLSVAVSESAYAAYDKAMSRGETTGARAIVDAARDAEEARMKARDEHEAKRKTQTFGDPD